MIRKSVDLPQPEGPRRVRTCPEGTTNETPSSARTPPGKTLPMPSPRSSPMSSALYRAAGQAARDAPLEEEHEQDEGGRGDDDGGRELAPGDLVDRGPAY